MHLEVKGGPLLIPLAPEPDEVGISLTNMQGREGVIDVGVVGTSGAMDVEPHV